MTNKGNRLAPPRTDVCFVKTRLGGLTFWCMLGAYLGVV